MAAQGGATIAVVPPAEDPGGAAWPLVGGLVGVPVEHPDGLLGDQGAGVVVEGLKALEVAAV